MRTLGIVSNCWRVQLERGIDLATLISSGADEGYTVFELRQGCLGRFETPDDHRPLAEALGELPRTFPDAVFNVALAFPFLSPGASPDDSLFLEGVEAAVACAGRFRPHLRLVDLTTSSQGIDVEVAAAADRVAALAERMAMGGGWSVENGFEPWHVLRDVLMAARAGISADANPRLCFDPCNLLGAADAPDPGEVTASLDPATLSMVHFKQRRDRRIQPTVCRGEIDWQRQIERLDAAGYGGPWLFEIAPDEDVARHTAESRRYLESCGF